MKKIGGHASLKPRSDIARFATKILAVLAVGFIGFVVFFYAAPFQYSFSVWAPDQPIAYSHKLHAGDLEINCQYCHAYARRSEMAGVPSVSKCMNCHSNLTIDSDQIAKLTEHYDQDKPLEWIRIYDLPDLVWFSHKRHIAKEIACQKCHGPVQTLVTNARLVKHNMSFCLNCHQQNGAPTDCLTCHM